MNRIIIISILTFTCSVMTFLLIILLSDLLQILTIELDMDKWGIVFICDLVFALVVAPMSDLSSKKETK